MRAIKEYLFWSFIALCVLFAISLFFPFFGHAVVGMVFGSWVCYKASVPLIWVVFFGCIIGSALGGWIIFDELVAMVLFAIASIVGFWGMYFYTLKLPDSRIR